MRKSDEAQGGERGYLRWLLGTAFVLGGALVMVLALFGRQLPPPPFSGSVSFDEKAVWLQPRLSQPCEVLAIGSSMTVNNLDAAVLGSDAFLNAASWGLKMRHIEYFLEVLLDYLDPSVVLVVTAPTDFEKDYRDREFVEERALRRFFEDGKLFGAHWRHLSANYLVGTLPELRRDRVGRGTYYSLDFDSGGCVPLDLMEEGFERWPERWDRPIARAENTDERNYASLKTMAQRCRDRGIRFLLVQAPIREAVLTPDDRRHLEDVHWPALKEICEVEGAEFLNFHGQLPLSEDDFADSTHLNRKGAGKLSRALLPFLGWHEGEVGLRAPEME